MKRVYDIKFFCKYDMRWYPFDQQTCHVEMLLDDVLENFAEVLPDNLEFSGPKELTQYFVKKYEMRKIKINTRPGIVVSLTLGRRILATFLTIFFPTILLNIIGHATNFFKPFFFEAVVSVNLTAMLVSISLVNIPLLCSFVFKVLTTMFINISNNLPKTSYIKMMDIWLIFNLLLPFLEVLMHTYMDTLRAEEEREVNHHGQTRIIGWEDIETDVDIKAKSQKTKNIQVRVCARKSLCKIHIYSIYCAR